MKIRPTLNASSTSGTFQGLNNSLSPFLYIALPVLNEAELLPRLLGCILSQDYRRFRVIICVNQPDEWWNVPGKKKICQVNLETMEYLRNYKGIDLMVIDRCTPGNGWKGKRHGVGWARKTIMDAVSQVAHENDIIVSLDADATFSGRYFSALAENFASHPDAVALAVPYLHKITGDEKTDRAMLRY